MTHYSDQVLRASDIHHVLRAKIMSGEIGAGKQLPSQAELCSSFNVPRHVLRKALDRLAKENLIISWQGRGAFARGDHLTYEIGERTRFGTNMVKNGCVLRIEVLPSKKPRVVDAQIAKLLGLSPRDTISKTELIHYVDDIPTAIGRHYFDPDRFPNIRDAIHKTNSVPKAFLAIGIDDYTRTATFVEARTPNASEALALDIPLSQPIMELRGRNVDQAGHVIEVTEAIVRADRVKLKI